MKKANLTAIILVISLFLCCCARDPYGACVIDGSAAAVIDETAFAAGYTPLEFTYPAGDGCIENNENLYGYLVIRTQDEFDSAFAPGAGHDVDFEKEMLVVFAFTAFYIRPVTLEGFTLEDGVLRVRLSMEKGVPGAGDSTAPFQRFVVIKTTAFDFTRADIKVI